MWTGVDKRNKKTERKADEPLMSGNNNAASSHHPDTRHLPVTARLDVLCSKLERTAVFLGRGRKKRTGRVSWVGKTGVCRGRDVCAKHDTMPPD